MQKTTSVSLGEHFESFVNHQIEAGHFASASEAVRAGLRLLEERETQVEILRRALQEGEASGPADFALSDILAELDAEDLH
jgi:antitoxin ParD1/3/4